MVLLRYEYLNEYVKRSVNSVLVGTPSIRD
nr:MAG TPA: hypothetical protein [Caudoviricetes sp.]